MAESEKLRDVAFDPDDPPEIEIIDAEKTPSLDLAKLEDLGVVELDTEERDGTEVITRCRINARYLAQMATEFHVVERRYGERWGLGSWNPEHRVRD